MRQKVLLFKGGKDGRRSFYSYIVTLCKGYNTRGIVVIDTSHEAVVHKHQRDRQSVIQGSHPAESWLHASFKNTFYSKGGASTSMSILKGCRLPVHHLEDPTIGNGRFAKHADNMVEQDIEN